MTYEVILRNRASQLVVLCDVSGSMGEVIDGTWRKIDTLREVIGQLEEMPIWLFSVYAERFDRDEPDAYEKHIRPWDNTNLAGALATLKAEGYRRVLVLTDGYPDNESEALREARGFHEIRIRYIGRPPMPRFLKFLASTASRDGDCQLIEFGQEKAHKIAQEFLRLAFLNETPRSR